MGNFSLFSHDNDFHIIIVLRSYVCTLENFSTHIFMFADVKAQKNIFEVIIQFFLPSSFSSQLSERKKEN